MLSATEYSAKYPEVRPHMILRGSRFVVDTMFVKHDVWTDADEPAWGPPRSPRISEEPLSLKGGGGSLSCPYPGGFVSVGLWDVTAWCALNRPAPVEPRADAKRKRPDAPRRWMDRAWAIRIFDYDDGYASFYSDDRAEIDELWAMLSAVESISFVRDLHPFGFQAE
jgi:hypothetical protein